MTTLISGWWVFLLGGNRKKADTLKNTALF